MVNSMSLPGSVSKPKQIITLETHPDVLKVLPEDRATPYNYACVLSVRMGKPPVPMDMIPRGTVRARVYRSQWLVDCPFCQGAMYASKKLPIFWCVECRMKGNQGKPLEVLFPVDVQTIEEILMMRPDATTRNWYPQETAWELARENAAHGYYRRLF